jgi:hypothetical protein
VITSVHSLDVVTLLRCTSETRDHAVMVDGNVVRSSGPRGRVVAACAGPCARRGGVFQSAVRARAAPGLARGCGGGGVENPGVIRFHSSMQSANPLGSLDQGEMVNPNLLDSVARVCWLEVQVRILVGASSVVNNIL